METVPMVRIALISSIFPSITKPYVGTFILEHVRSLITQDWIDEIYVINPSRLQKYPNSLSRLIKINKFDLIDAQFAVPAGVLAFVKPSVPMVLTTHRWEVVDYDNFFLRFLLKKIFSRSNRIIAVSNFIANQVINISPRELRKIKIVHNSVDVKKIQSYRKPTKKIRKLLEKSDSNNSLKIITVSQLIKRKGIDLVIKALSQMPHQIEYEYYIVGTGPEKSRLKLLIERLKVSKHVHLVNYLVGPDLYSLINNTDIFVLMSSSEGHSVAVLEAKVAGNFIILGNYPGADEALYNGVEGVIISLDPLELQETLKKIWKHPDIIRKIKQYNFKNASKHDHYKKMIKIKEIYLGVVEDHE